MAKDILSCNFLEVFVTLVNLHLRRRPVRRVHQGHDYGCVEVTVYTGAILLLARAFPLVYSILWRTKV